MAKRRLSDLRKAQMQAGYVFVLPSILLYAAFVLAPVAITIILSFTYYDISFGADWVGFENYVRFLTEPRSLEIFWNTLRFAFLAVSFNVAVGLILALALNRAMPKVLLYFFRLAFFLPVIISAAFVAVVWSYFYSVDFGVINYYLAQIGIGQVPWLSSSKFAMTSIVIMDVWKNTGFFMIILIAALQGVPKPIMDAASMDGASAWRRFSRITLPFISPVLFFCIVFASIGALQVFESIMILTGGGPGDSTRSLSIYLVDEAFGSFELGYAAAVSVIMMILVLIITIIQIIGSRRWVRE
jgi:multiple sugar transport system permease protein